MSDAGGCRVGGRCCRTCMLAGACCSRLATWCICCPAQPSPLFAPSPCTPARRLAPEAASAAAAFRYLSQSGVYSLTDVDDSHEFRHTLEAMRIVGLQQPHVEAGGCG